MMVIHVIPPHYLILRQTQPGSQTHHWGFEN